MNKFDASTKKIEFLLLPELYSSYYLRTYTSHKEAGNNLPDLKVSNENCHNTIKEFKHLGLMVEKTIPLIITGENKFYRWEAQTNLTVQTFK